MAENQIRILMRKKETAGSYPIPADAFLGEPFLNTYDGILLFSGSPGGTYQPSAGQPGVFEVGSTVSVLKALSGINLNNKFIVTATTGQITTYAGQSNFAGQFLSGTSAGFVLAPISSISSASAGNNGDIQYNNGTGGFGANSNFNFSSNTLFTPYLKVSNSISAATIYSGSTNLYDIFLTQASNDITRVQPGSNISTGGTENYPIVSLVSSPSVNNFTASGTSTITTASITTLSAGTIISGSTNLSNLFATQSVTNLISAQLITKANLSGATFTGTVNAPIISATTLSAGTIISGSTNLYNIFQAIGSDLNKTYIQPGLNTYTAGTIDNPSVNISSVTLNSLVVTGNTNITTLSANTIYSGSTDLSNLFATQLTTNLISAQLITKANLSGATFTGNVNAVNISATTLSAGTMISGNTNLYNIFQTIGSDANKTYIQSGLNTYTAGTVDNPSVNISSATLNSLSVSGTSILGDTSTDNLTVRGNLFVQGTTFTSNTENILVSANTITLNFGEQNSGVTKGYSGILIDRGIAEKYEFAFDESSDTFRVGVTGNTQPVATRQDSPISNGFAYWNPTFFRFDTTTSISASTFISGSTDLSNLFATQSTTNLISAQLITKANLSGATFTGDVSVVNISATTLSAGTMISGSTDLYNIFQTIGSDLNKTYVQSGLNTYTAGTVDNPSVNISSATLNSLVVTGDTNLAILSAATIYSGSTNLYNIFALDFDVIDGGTF